MDRRWRGGARGRRLWRDPPSHDGVARLVDIQRLGMSAHQGLQPLDPADSLPTSVGGDSLCIADRLARQVQDLRWAERQPQA